jgi:hypothetical protein
MRHVALLCLTTTLLAGCTLSDLQFHNDKRLQFLAPKARALVTTPLTIRWSMRDFQAGGVTGSAADGQGAFVLFLDRAPMRAGKDLKWLARQDASCKRDPRCPDSKYLADRGIYVTTTPSVTLASIPAEADGVGNEQHFVNVVLVDGTGRRIGESAWYLPFQTARRSGS